MLARIGAVLALAVILGYARLSIGTNGVVGGHAWQCSSELIYVWQGSDGPPQGQIVAWQRVSDFGTYEFDLPPGDYYVVAGTAPSVEVHLAAGDRLTQDVSCQPG